MPVQQAKTLHLHLYVHLLIYSSVYKSKIRHDRRIQNLS